MVKHVILWQLKDEFNEENKIIIKQNAKTAIEGLLGKIDGLVSINVNVARLDSSNADMMLDTTFESEEALKAYQTHPLHKEAADKFVRPFTKCRLCLDYEV